MLLHKTYATFHPVDEESSEEILALYDGVYECTLTRKRNPQFLRKYFALLDVGFQLWEPELTDYNGKQVVKNRNRFRKDIAIATGFYELTVNIRGDVRAEAKSISFGAMDETEFSKLYNMTIDYLLAKVIQGDKEQLNNHVAQILDFT
jgi:hypothetical protein